eukprot:TRINITY_DN18166_c0_g1_i1.p1 TRINITY_DN18166_c0_g1~~TRINITY_DN18166_c0_g1_i1.p1  ORF type:complete len:818 (+),score=227.11 TRINITY_DN18166_c0_g1_i1:270-2723(+)
MALMSVRRLQYDVTLIPEGGVEVISSMAEFDKAHKKEPAGHLFHAAALRAVGHGPKAEEEEEGGDGEKAEGAAKAAAADGASADDITWGTGKKKKKGKGEDGMAEQDHYQLLALSHLRYLATEDQIRKAYRDAALKHHPDKQASTLLEEVTEEAKAAKKEEIETRFKAIQMAYEILMDPVKRRNFDSTDEFDDDVPSDCAPEDFFKIFGPCFMRNGRWSVNQPVPMPGDNDTGIEEVDKFYDFWWAFKSWREFPNEDDFDLETAESREHKRWMERQNAKSREKAKKEENARMRLLVENAYRRDPRIARRKEEEKKEKQRKKDAKHATRRAAEAEEKRAAEEEKARKEEEEKRAAEEAALSKKAKEKDKKLLRKERARLRTAAAECIAGAPIGKPALPWGVPDEHVEDLCQALNIDQIKALCERLECKVEAGRRAITLRRWHGAVIGGEGTVQWEGSVLAGDAEAEEKADADFVSADCYGPSEAKPGGNAATTMANGGGAKAHCVASNGVSEKSTHGHSSGKHGLANGVGGGSSANAKGVAGGEGKSGGDGKKGNGVAEVAKKAPEVKKDKPWGKEEVDLLRKGLTKFPKGTSQRWEVVSDYVGTGRSVDEILRAVKTVLLQKPDDSKVFDTFLQKRKNLRDIESPLSARDDFTDSVTLPTPAVANGTAPSGKTSDAKSASKATKATKSSSPPEAKATAEGKGKPEAGKAKANGVAPCGAGPEMQEGGAGNGGETAAGGEAQVSWSEAQELALVKALKAFPKETTNRWERISAAVPGKNKAQCQRKYLLFRDNLRSAKGSAAASSGKPSANGGVAALD